MPLDTTTISRLELQQVQELDDVEDLDFLDNDLASIHPDPACDFCHDPPKGRISLFPTYSALSQHRIDFHRRNRFPMEGYLNPSPMHLMLSRETKDGGEIVEEATISGVRAWYRDLRKYLNTEPGSRPLFMVGNHTKNLRHINEEPGHVSGN